MKSVLKRLEARMNQIEALIFRSMPRVQGTEEQLLCLSMIG